MHAEHPDHAVMTTPQGPAPSEEHLRWAMEITQLPSASGREQRVADWVHRWVEERPDLIIESDPSRNLTIRPRELWGEPSAPPLYITAHMDHPAFVVTRALGPAACEVEFRGGVMDVFFDRARLVIHAASGERIGATLAGRSDMASPFGPAYIAELDTAGEQAPAGEDPTWLLRPGDVGVWALPPAEVDANHCLRTLACDDLAALAAALAAMDVLRQRRAAGETVHEARLLLTRAEEIGFVGAIAACRHGTIPGNARIIALENSRAFPESPIHGGPIVRVGDRLSIFSPALTAAVAQVAESYFGRPAQPVASQTSAELRGRPWQRKLMAGGACEASVFCAYGLEATCVCLPLGNYHNMPRLADLQAGTYDAERLGPPRAAREFISIHDYQGLIDLLAACACTLSPADPVRTRVEKLFAQRSGVLAE